MRAVTRKAVSFLMGTAVFCGLPLVGWGLGDTWDFFHNVVRSSYVLMMLVLTLLVVLFVPEEGRGHGAGKKIVKRQKLAVMFLQIISLAVVIVAPYCDRRGIIVMGLGAALRWLGLGIAFIGFGFMNWAVIALENQFSTDVTIQDDHKLITKGLYRYLRHPRYLGIILFLSGVSMVFHSWIAFIFAAASVPVLIWRIQDEEKLMHQEFADAWQAYTKRSWRLIPYVY
ncbi:MAG: isoprenylcysteine carboxylmethyltransferase family protein [Sedimentisphaerales bacterium]